MRKLRLLFVFCLAAPAFAGRQIDFSLGPIRYSFQDMPRFTYVTPTILEGRGTGLRLSYVRNRRNKSETISFNLNSIGRFSYNTGSREIGLSSDQGFTELGLTYDLRMFLLRDALIRNLDFGIGPVLRLDYLNFRRRYEPDYATRLKEGRAIVSLASTALFRPVQWLHFEAGLSGGFIAGLSRTTHSVSGNAPLRSEWGYLIGIQVGAGISLGPRIELSVDYRRQSRTVGREMSSYSDDLGLLSFSIGYILGN